MIDIDILKEHLAEEIKNSYDLEELNILLCSYQRLIQKEFIKSQEVHK